MRVAIFDFDGTLYKEETFQLMMDHFKHHPTYKDRYGPFFRKILPRYIGYKLKIYPEDRMKEKSMQLYISGLGKLSREELDLFFEELADKARPGFNEKVVSEVETLHNQGVYTMLVSGAYTPFLQAVTNALPFDKIIGTDIPLKNDMVDMSQNPYHIQGKRKNKQIYDVLENKQVDWDHSYAYGDSFSDLSVLELVGHPVAVHPDNQLKSIAEERNWIIFQ